MTMPASVRHLDSLSAAWAADVRTAAHEARNLMATELYKLTPSSGWGTYPDFSDPQMMKFGPVVVLVGMLRNNTGANVGTNVYLTAAPPSQFFRRAAGSAAPLGGHLMWANEQSGTTTGPARIDIYEGGVYLAAATTPTYVVPNGWISMQAAWFVE